MVHELKCMSHYTKQELYDMLSDCQERLEKQNAIIAKSVQLVVDGNVPHDLERLSQKVLGCKHASLSEMKRKSNKILDKLDCETISKAEHMLDRAVKSSCKKSSLKTILDDEAMDSMKRCSLRRSQRGCGERKVLDIDQHELDMAIRKSLADTKREVKRSIASSKRAMGM